MKFDLISDIHIDVNKHFQPKPPNPGSELLVIAGDVAEIQSLRNTRFEIFKQYKDLYKEVLYVAGNHEYYGSNIQETNLLIAEWADMIGFRFLQSEVFEVTGTNVVFVGGTLWTDMNNEDVMTVFGIKNMMADWTYIGWQEEDALRVRGDPLHVGRFKPLKSVELHRRFLCDFENACDKYHDRDIVLVTHHAMSHKSIAPRWQPPQFHTMNGGFASDCDWFFHKHKNVKIHCHGHMHDYLRYDLGGATIHCNPYGYQAYSESKPHYGPEQIEV
jgi:predicted phosphodiesterase